MKQYKKTIALALALVLSLSLAACASKTETAASTETASTETASETTESKGTITVAASPTPHAEILAQAKPILDEFHAWLLDTRRQLSKKSGLADAIGYALNHWQALFRS